MCRLQCTTVVCYDLFFFFNDTATTEIYTLSLHDALPIFDYVTDYYSKDGEKYVAQISTFGTMASKAAIKDVGRALDRKSTRLNSSHQIISYAVFCLKKKKYRINMLYFDIIWCDKW